MRSRELDRFGAFVVEKLWDDPMEHHRTLARGKAKAPSQQALQRRLAAADPATRRLVRDCVVEALSTATHGFLAALQESHDLEKGMAFLVDGKNVAAVSEWLQAEPFGADGWVARYSKQRRRP